jgi:hypothetical protein
MFWLKACPKYHGDLYNSKDAYGSFIACMQCSRYLTQAEEAELVLATAKSNLWDNRDNSSTKKINKQLHDPLCSWPSC